jgi:hypothetical protein
MYELEKEEGFSKEKVLSVYDNNQEKLNQIFRDVVTGSNYSKEDIEKRLNDVFPVTNFDMEEDE